MPDIKLSQLTAATELNPDAIIPVVQTDPNDGIVKNFSARASQFATGVQLLGKLIGANMNLANSATIEYTGQTGFAFQVGDTVTDSTGATAVITADSGTALTVSSINISSGAFTISSTMQGTIGQISYGSLTGTFQTAEEIDGQTSGAKGFVVTDGSGTMTLSSVSGTFTIGESIIGGTSAATAVITNFTAPASASVVSYTFISGDQPITLSGGTAYVVTDVVITNASIGLTTASGGYLYTGPGMSGSRIASVSGNYSELALSSSYFNNVNGIDVGSPPASIGSIPIASTTNNSPIYFSLGTAQGSTATVDIYVYGYILY